MLDHKDLHTIEARCTQEASPRCRTACPLDMDVRSLLENMAADKLREARKLLERHLPLPSILTAVCDHPCEDACLRRDYGGSLSISALEKFCMAAEPQQIRPMIRPPKAQSIAVLGAGLAGLTVAYEISHKAFSVTVYHDGDVADVLRSAFPSLEEQLVTEEYESLIKWHVRFVRSLLDEEFLATIAEKHDAVFVDASCCDFAPSRREDVDPITLLWKGNTCCGGWLESTPTGARYPSSSLQAGDGRRAAITLQRIITGASLVAAREGENRLDRLHVDMDGVTSVARVLPAADIYTAEEARCEADRCLWCSCLQCVKACAFLQKYKEFPRVYARKIYNNASVVRGTRTGNVLMNGCALCGQCEAICPEHFSMAELCLEARRDAVARDVMPESAHEFALEDMAQASGKECAFYLEDVSLPAGRHASYMFFPGCQLIAARGEQVLAMYRFLRQSLDGGVSLYSTCCGIPAHWAGREQLFADHARTLFSQWETSGRPQLLVACASCMEALRIALPEAEITPLWTILDTLLPEQFDSPGPKRMSVQDPCGARYKPEWRQAVRSLAVRAGIRLEETQLTAEQSACCGYGGLVWNAQADLAEQMAKNRAAGFAYPILASCIMCRDRFAGFQESWHMFDILPPTAGVGSGPDTAAPGLSARRAGRIELKNAALYEFKGESVPEAAEVIQLRISDPVLQAMERRYILRQDVLEAVIGVENSGAKFYNRENGHFLGSWRPRNVTFWVEYSLDPDGAFILHNSWCHRMVLPGATQPASEVMLVERVHA